MLNSIHWKFSRLPLRRYCDSQITRKDTRKDYVAQYCALHKDDKRDYDRRYRSENKDKVGGAKVEYRSRNKDKFGDLKRLYRAKKRAEKDSDSFIRAPYKSWKTADDVRAYFDSIAQSLCISNPSDWYRISRAQLTSLGGLNVYFKFGTLANALRFAYPDITWEDERFSVGKKKKSEQRVLKRKIQELLPGVEIVEDFQHPDLHWDDSDRAVEIDLWIPKYGIGIEYQGEHHFLSLESAFGPNGAAMYPDRDSSKQALCEKRGVTLIVIPYWWDGGIESLSATLYQARPEVFPATNAVPIPSSTSRSDSNETRS